MYRKIQNLAIIANLLFFVLAVSVTKYNEVKQQKEAEKAYLETLKFEGGYAPIRMNSLPDHMKAELVKKIR